MDGTQAEQGRIPHADTSLHQVPEGADEDALLMLSDTPPAGFECGVLNGAVKPGNTLVIVESGRIGLAALLTAQLYSPAEIIMIDADDNRLERARSLGATQAIISRDGQAADSIMSFSQGVGVEVAIEAMGSATTFAICQGIVAAGGHVANIGMQGTSVELESDRLWDRNVTITTRLVGVVTTPMLLESVHSGRLAPQELITHEFEFGEMKKAYAAFGDAASERALEVILRAE